MKKYNFKLKTLFITMLGIVLFAFILIPSNVMAYTGGVNTVYYYAGYQIKDINCMAFGYNKTHQYFTEVPSWVSSYGGGYLRVNYALPDDGSTWDITITYLFVNDTTGAYNANEVAQPDITTPATYPAYSFKTATLAAKASPIIKVIQSAAFSEYVSGEFGTTTGVVTSSPSYTGLTAKTTAGDGVTLVSGTTSTFTTAGNFVLTINGQKVAFKVIAPPSTSYSASVSFS